MLMELEATRLLPRTSGQARPVGWSEPARLVAAKQRLIVLIEGNQSCRGTIAQRAFQACSNVVTHQRLPITALALLEQYPYRSRPTLPTQRPLYTIDARVFVVAMQALLAARCRSDFLHSLLAVNVPSTTDGPARYVETHGAKGLVQEKGTEICVLDTSQTHSKDLCWAVSHTWRVSQARPLQKARSHTRAFFAFGDSWRFG
jgi:hypothetical protein